MTRRAAARVSAFTFERGDKRRKGLPGGGLPLRGEGLSKSPRIPPFRETIISTFVTDGEKTG